MPNIRININLAILLLIVFILVTSAVFSQSRDDLEKKKKKTQEEIAYTNKLLNETKKNQQNSLQQLKLLETKITKRQELIYDISLEVKDINDKITDKTENIQSMEAELEQLKSEYAKLIYFAFKNRNSYNRWMYILSSDNFNQAYRRLKYLQQYSEYRQRQVQAIKSIQTLLIDKIAELEKQKQKKEGLVKNQQEETIALSLEKNEQDKLLVSLKSQEEDLRKQLAEKRKNARKLEKAIEDLIAKEAKASSGNSGTYQLTPEEKLISDQFGANKGRLPWPTERGVVTETFGEHEHKKLKGIKTRNDGITITTTKGSSARAVFDGVVRQVITIPGKHKVVIIRHGDYLSVYSNLKEVYVSSGDNVSSKEEIGLIYTDSEEGRSTTVDLQIWKGTVKLNPMLWLSKK